MKLDHLRRLLGWLTHFIDAAVCLLLIPNYIYYFPQITRNYLLPDNQSGEKLIAWSAAVIFVPLVFSAVRLTTIYFTAPRLAWREKYGEEAPSFGKKLAFLFTMPDHVSAFALLAAVYAALPAKITCPAINELLPEGGKLVVLAIAAVMTFAAKLTAVNYWCSKRDEAAYGKKAEFRDALTFGIAYGVGGIALPMLVPAAVSLGGVLGTVVSARLIAVIAAICATPFILRQIRAFFKRRSFLKQLKRLCKEKKIKLSNISRPYSSAYNIRPGESFCVSDSGETYSCVMLSARRMNTPFVLMKNGDVKLIFNINLFKIHLFSFTRTHSFGYETPHKKVVILNPSPRNAMTTDGDGRPVPIDNGEIIGDYTVYNATAFLNSLERGSLCRREKKKFDINKYLE